MASFWEMDPFFAAAEEVQNSMDRMDSLYRDWKFNESLAKDNPNAAANVDRRDVLTALDTVRWQLQDFARAVEKAQHVYVGEDASSRHAQFVRAIQSQIESVAMEIGPPKHQYGHFEEDDRECLALFLSGRNSGNDNTEVRIDEQELEEWLSMQSSASSSSNSSSSSSSSSSNCHQKTKRWLPYTQHSGLKRWKDGDSSLDLDKLAPPSWRFQLGKGLSVGRIGLLLLMLLLFFCFCLVTTMSR